MRQLSAKLETTKSQLEALKKAKVDENLSGPQDIRRSYEAERRQLQGNLKELEAVYSQLEAAKKGLDRENQRLRNELVDKDSEIKVSFLNYYLVR